jgi:hypothetical protein
VLVDFGVGSGKTGLEGRVNQADLSPVADGLLVGFKEEYLENHLPVNGTEVLGVETSFELAALKGCRDCANARLGSLQSESVGCPKRFLGLFVPFQTCCQWQRRRGQ